MKCVRGSLCKRGLWWFVVQLSLEFLEQDQAQMREPLADGWIKKKENIHAHHTCEYINYTEQSNLRMRGERISHIKDEKDETRRDEMRSEETRRDETRGEDWSHPSVPGQSAISTAGGLTSRLHPILLFEILGTTSKPVFWVQRHLLGCYGVSSSR